MHPTVRTSAPGTRLGRVLCRLAALACLVASGTTFAQTWPERPVHLVVPFATGGGPDFSARALAADLAVRLHQQVVVDNRPGGNSVIGALAVARAPADGYTLLFTSGATVSVLPHIAHNLPLDPVRDLVPVAGVAKTPIFLVVHPSVPANDLRSFLAQARTHPGALTYASAGNGTGSNLGFEMLKHATAVNIVHVPYKSTASALPDLLAARVSSMMSDLTVVQPHLRSGALRVLGVSTPERSSLLPDVPTLAEQGIEGFDLQLWFGLFAPRGTAPAVIRDANTAVQAYLRSAEATAAFANVAYLPFPSTAAELDALVGRESARWAELARIGAIRGD